jgi:hypothetical protein
MGMIMKFTLCDQLLSTWPLWHCEWSKVLIWAIKLGSNSWFVQCTSFFIKKNCCLNVNSIFCFAGGFSVWSHSQSATAACQ